MIRRSNYKIYIYLGFGVVIPFILVMIYLIGLYYYLYGVENYNSRVYLEKYLDLLASEDYEKIMQYNGIETDEFNSVEQFKEYMLEQYGENREKRVIIKDENKSTKDIHYYNVQINGKKIREYEVKKTKEVKSFIFNTWEVSPSITENIKNKIVKAFLPEGVALFVNGVEISDEYKTGETIPYKEFKCILDEDYDLPKADGYEVGNLMSISSVEVKRKDGGACNLDEKDGIYYATSNIPPAQIEILKPLAEEFAKKYAAFVSEDYRFVNLVKYMYVNSSFYYTLKEFYNGWFPTHTGYGYENIEFFKMKMYDDDHASVQVRFNYFITHGASEKRDYPIAYDVLFAKINGEWLVVDVKNF